MGILDLILPVFVIILTGWFMRAIGVFKEETASHLILYVFYISGPAILFVSVATIPFEEIWHWDFIVTYGLITLIGSLLLLFYYRIFAKVSLTTGVLYSMSGTLSNAGFIGLPVLYAIFGHKAVVPGGLSLLVVLIIMSFQIFLLEASILDQPKFSQLIAKSFLGLAKNPLVLGMAAGVLYSLTGLGLERGVDKYFHLFASSLAPCALFAVGLQLHMKSFVKNFKDTFFLSFTKLVVMPVIVFIVVLLFDVTPLWAISAIIVSALPTAKSCTIFAGIYEKEERAKHRISETIASTTLISIVTLIVWLFILNHIYPSVIR